MDNNNQMDVHYSNSNNNNNNNNNQIIMIDVDDNNYNDTKFFKFWRNVIIRNVVFKFIGIYKKNEYIVFKNVQSLLEYPEREFIKKIALKCENLMEPFELEKGYLPIYGVLEEVDMTTCFSKFLNCDIFPEGVQKVWFANNNLITVSELPSTVTTVKNVRLKKPYANNVIPDNITSIAFNHISLDHFEFHSLRLPNSIESLDLSCMGLLKGYYEPLPAVPLSICPSFMPSSLTSLTIGYNHLNIVFPNIPWSVTKLRLILKSDYDFNQYGGDDGAELSFGGSGSYEDKMSGGLSDSITKLGLANSITMNEFEPEPNQIPNSVTDLNIQFLKYPDSFDNIFPDYLTKLVIKRKKGLNPPPKLSAIPSLEHLEIDGEKVNLPSDDSTTETKSTDNNNNNNNNSNITNKNNNSKYTNNYLPYVTINQSFKNEQMMMINPGFIRLKFSFFFKDVIITLKCCIVNVF